jgi:hypothetical protein
MHSGLRMQGMVCRDLLHKAINGEQIVDSAADVLVEGMAAMQAAAAAAPEAKVTAGVTGKLASLLRPGGP